MITLRPAAERGNSNLGWLDSRHTFSFSEYYDPRQMGFRALRVINEDRVTPGAGFGTHGHQDMEIITYVLEGTIAHKDSMGHVEELHTGELQRMSAGTGLTHSEYNASKDEPLHFYQIWLLPNHKGHKPGYEQKTFVAAERKNRWHLVVQPDGGSRPKSSGGAAPLTIHQDARILLADLNPSHSITYDLAAGRHAWLQVLSGSVELNDKKLDTSDGAAISDEAQFSVRANTQPSRVLLFDLG